VSRPPEPAIMETSEDRTSSTAAGTRSSRNVLMRWTGRWPAGCVPSARG